MLNKTQYKERLYKMHKQLANDVMKTKPAWLLDIKAHFKRKDAWPLSYMFYFQESKLYSPAQFNIILKKIGVRAAFTKHAELCIYKAKK